MTLTEQKQKALAEYLGIEVEEVTEGYDENHFEAEGNEYLVLTEEEREEEVTAYIKESIWAFNASFLAGETGLPEEVFTALSEKCESGNEAILKLIEKTCGLEKFVDSATSADGYGHFLSPYDGEENEINVESEKEEDFEGMLYIYRTN